MRGTRSRLSRRPEQACCGQSKAHGEEGEEEGEEVVTWEDAVLGVMALTPLVAVVVEIAPGPSESQPGSATPERARGSG